MSIRKVLVPVILGSVLVSWAHAQPQATAPARPAPTVAMSPAGEARRAQDLLESSCTACHDLGVLTATPHTPQEWPVVLKRMVGHGLNMSPTDLSTVQAYLIETYAAADAH